MPSDHEEGEGTADPGHDSAIAKQRWAEAFGPNWIAGIAGALVVAGFLALVGIFAHGSDNSEQSTPPRHRSDPFVGGVRAIAGFGPTRPAFRCARPTSCDGPTYVTFNSYINNPVVGDERPFLTVKDAESSPRSVVVDTLSVSDTTDDLIFRAYIDNDTFQRLPHVQTGAVNTRLRLALPKGPVYVTNPTIYLRASNAKPRTVWDTVTLRSPRPMMLTYVPGSARLDRRNSAGRTVGVRLGDGITDAAGLGLGTWKADFAHSGYVTFRVRVDLMPEPVRNPQATRGIGGDVVYARAATHGRAREPVRDGFAGDRFRCQRSTCQGPPFPELNAYENHPLLGDEADFVRGADGNGYGDEGRRTYRTVALVQPGDKINVRVAIDNGGDPNSIGAPRPDQLIARDVRVSVLLPSAMSGHLAVVVFIDSSTTRPKRIIDTLPVRSTQPVRLRLRRRTAGLLTATGLRAASPKLFAASPVPRAKKRWGIRVGDIPPSFSQVVYVEFDLDVER